MSLHQLQWIDKFAIHLEFERRVSRHTVDNYARDLQQLLTFCDAQGIKNWQALSVHHIRAFSAAQHRSGISGRSLQRRLSAIRSFYNFLMREGEVDANPCHGIRAPKSPRHLPKTLDVDQMTSFLNHAIPDTPLAVRDQAMFELFYSSGLRLTELTNLDTGDIDLNDATARVLGKGQKIRVAPIGRYAMQTLETWLEKRPQLATSDETALFVSNKGKRLSTRSVQLRLRQRGLQQGMAIGMHPHMLRRSCASHLLESSSNLRAVQELLGHADIGTTQIYTHLDFQHLANVYDKTHPRAKRHKSKN